MIYKKTNIYNVPYTEPAAIPVKLSGTDYYGYKKDVYLSDLSSLFIGAPNMGKSTAIIKCLNTMAANPDAVTVVLDIKGEYLKNCFSPGDLVLSLNDMPGVPKANHVKWSLMKEAIMFGEKPEHILKEISEMIFKDAIENSQNKAFPEAAMLVFYGQLVHIYRSCGRQIPYTKQLIEKILTVTDSEIENSVSKYKDLFAVRNLVSKDENITSFGIKMELKEVLLNTFIFDSNFCGSDSRFSIREFIRKGRGHKLFVEFSFKYREATSSIIRVLLDLAMKEAISGECIGAGDKTRYNFVFDEYAYITSGLSYLDALREVGRSKGCRLICGCQNINQLSVMNNGRTDKADEDVAGFSNLIVFKSNDANTTAMVSARSGTESTEIVKIDSMCNVTSETKEMPVVTEEDLASLGQGEVIILPSTGRSFFLKLDK